MMGHGLSLRGEENRSDHRRERGDVSPRLGLDWTPVSLRGSVFSWAIFVSVPVLPSSEEADGYRKRISKRQARPVLPYS